MIDLDDPVVRGLFNREAVLRSDWYQERLATKQARDVALWRRNVHYLEEFVARRERVATALRVHDDSLETREERPPEARSGGRPAGEQVVSREDEWRAGAQQRDVELGGGEPLEMEHVGGHA